MAKNIVLNYVRFKRQGEMEFSEDSTVSKLMLLFIMEKMEIPLTENSIIDICTSRNDWMNYMECKDVLYQLTEANFVYKTERKGDAEERYTITYEGQNCLEHFYLRIPAELREQITEYAKENRAHFKRSQEYVADYMKENDGSYTVVMKIKSSTIGQNMFELRIKTPSRQSAIEACKNWREKAHLVYEYVYETLINF